MYKSSPLALRTTSTEQAHERRLTRGKEGERISHCHPIAIARFVMSQDLGGLASTSSSRGQNEWEIQHWLLSNTSFLQQPIYIGQNTLKTIQPETEASQLKKKNATLAVTWMQVQRLVVAEVGEAAAPLGHITRAVAEDLALHLGRRQAGLDRFLLPIN